MARAYRLGGRICGNGRGSQIGEFLIYLFDSNNEPLFDSNGVRLTSLKG